MSNQEPERVYIGLPQNLEVFWVERRFRTNPLSHVTIPGLPDIDVVVELQDGRAFGYDLIKFPFRYIETFFSGPITVVSADPLQDYVSSFLTQKLEVRMGGFEWSSRSTQISLVKQVISRIFVRECDSEIENERNQVPFEEVWNAQTSSRLPWDTAVGTYFDDHYPDDDMLDEVHQPQSMYEYYGYEMESWEEDPVEKAERLWGIPDPRLVED